MAWVKMAALRKRSSLPAGQVERFLEKIEKTDSCWLWTGKPAPGVGYGRFKIKAVTHYAHRLAYDYFVGPIPEDDSYHGICVCHKCDVRLCVNPEHLFLGTAQDNMLDKMSKDRHRCPAGEMHGRATLTWGEVSEIRKLRLQGVLLREISARFGVSPPTISMICNGRLWAK